MLAQQPIANYNGKPQLEDGYTRIANELLEAIILFKFTERQYKIFFAILRKTYGFNKPSDEISLSQISALCNMPINHVSTVINQLVKLNIIIKKQGKFAKNLMINKQYDTWGLHNVECLNVELHTVDDTVTSSGVLPFHNMEVQKTTPKDNTKDNSKSRKKSDVSLKTFLEPYTSVNKDVFDDDDAIFDFALNAGIPLDFLHLGWLSFRNTFIDDESAKQKDWKAHFRNYLRKGWLKIWYFKDDGQCYLNAAGMALQNYEKNKAKNG